MNTYTDLTTDELVTRFNETFGKSIKKGSYTRAKMIADLEAHDKENQTNPHACPFCGGDPSNQTPAGEEGTFLGDFCNECHECGKIYNAISEEEVEGLPETASKKRKILNPQNKINAKTEACAKEGIEVFYDKSARTWAFADNTNGMIFIEMTSRQFSGYSPKELAAYAVKIRDRK